MTPETAAARDRRPGKGGGGRRPRQRLDLLLVARGLAESRERAQAAVMAGEVLVDGQRVEKPGALTRPEAVVTLEPRRRRYVSRGGLKLERALDLFGIPVTGAVALDVGASTGGFTDCLLQRGATRVYAVDVGTGQLHWRLRQDPRVVVRERTHAAALSEAVVPGEVDLATVDVSFISLTRVLPAVVGRVRPGGSILALVKPQFEAGRAQVRKGVVRSPDVHQEVLRRLTAWMRGQGWTLRGLTASPLPGPEGNLEFFVWIVKDAGREADNIDDLIPAVVAEAHATAKRPAATVRETRRPR